MITRNCLNLLINWTMSYKHVKYAAFEKRLPIFLWIIQSISAILIILVYNSAIAELLDCMCMGSDHSSPLSISNNVRVRAKVIKDGNAVGLTSILDRRQFVFHLRGRVKRPIYKKVAHTRLPIVGFRSWSVSLQVTRVINPVVGCHYFPPGLQLPWQLLRELLSISLLGEQRKDGCEQFA